MNMICERFLHGVTKGLTVTFSMIGSYSCWETMMCERFCIPMFVLSVEIWYITYVGIIVWT